MSAFLRAGESLTPSPVTATMAPCLWHPSTMMSFCCGDVRANTISEWLASTSSICAGVMSRRSLPWTTHAFASLQCTNNTHTATYNTFFELDSTGRTRGRVSTDLRQHFFSERIVNIWNRLEPSTVESQSLNIFKSKLQLLHDKDESFFGQ